MTSTVQNPDVEQMDDDHAVVVAVASRAVFNPGAEDEEGVYGVGMAFPLLQALQKVNEHLLQLNPEESLVFDVVLITTDSQQQQQSSTITTSTRRYGVQVSRFSFSSEDDFVESLLKNKVQLFLSTDGNQVLEASQKGVLSVLLNEDTASCPSDQLRVLLCDAIDPSRAAQGFLSQLGKIRRKFGMLDSPLCIGLVTSCGGRQRCAGVLKTLRSLGIVVDEAFCLAGAPRGPILSLLRPHFLLSSTQED